MLVGLFGGGDEVPGRGIRILQESAVIVHVGRSHVVQGPVLSFFSLLVGSDGIQKGRSQKEGFVRSGRIEGTSKARHKRHGLQEFGKDAGWYGSVVYQQGLKVGWHGPIEFVFSLHGIPLAGIATARVKLKAGSQEFQNDRGTLKVAFFGKQKSLAVFPGIRRRCPCHLTVGKKSNIGQGVVVFTARTIGSNTPPLVSGIIVVVVVVAGRCVAAPPGQISYFASDIAVYSGVSTELESFKFGTPRAVVRRSFQKAVGGPGLQCPEGRDISSGNIHFESQLLQSVIETGDPVGFSAQIPNALLVLVPIGRVKLKANHDPALCGGNPGGAGIIKSRFDDLHGLCWQ